MIDRILESEAFWTAAVAVLLAIWGAMKAWAGSLELRSRRTERLREIAIEALEVGVHEAWERRGKEWKRDIRGVVAGPKLTEDQKAKLREIAITVAQAQTHRHGVDLNEVLDGPTIAMLLRDIVDARKNQ